MKHVILIFFIIPSITRAQVDLPLNTSGKAEFTKTIDLDSISKKKLHAKAKLWVVNAFKSANNVIQYDDADEGRIVGKGNADIRGNGTGMAGSIHRDQAGHVNFTVEILSKDNKCRIRIYDIYHEAVYSGGVIENKKPACGGLYMTAKTWNSIQKQTSDLITGIALNFRDAITNENNDW